MKEAALALGATRWEMVRGVVLPYVERRRRRRDQLGLGRALGEAIAVTQVIGNAATCRARSSRPRTRSRAGSPASTRAPTTTMQVARSLYLAPILLAITLVTNVSAQLLVRRFEQQRVGGS